MPERSESSLLSSLRQRAFLCAQIRSFFTQRGVLEVSTPVLSAAGNTDLQIDPFVSDALVADSGLAYLRTSPEFFHKRLLAVGVGDLFEIGPVFRRGEHSGRHNPEFTLLEWYRLGFQMVDLIAEVVDLIQSLASAFALKPLPVERFSFREVFESQLQVNPFGLSDQALFQQCQTRGYHGPVLDRTAALDFLFGVAVMPVLDAQTIHVIHGFPIEQAALAMQDPEDPACALRFEVLWGGMELANGYQELTDTVEQRRRFEHDNAVRAVQNKPLMALDEHLLAAMHEPGLPDCSGVAVGLDRLLMCLLGESDIRQVMAFPADLA